MTDKIEQAGFEAWQDAQAAMFDLLMVNKYGAKDSARSARKHLADAVAALDAALDAPATATEGVPI